MLKFLGNVHPLILDVSVLAILVLIVFFGIIRGIKKTLLGIVLFTVSVVLAFSKYMDSVKGTIIEKVLFIDKLLPAGSGNFYSFAVSLFLSLIASLILFLLFYLVFRAIVALISIIRKRKFYVEQKKKTKIGRVFGGVISLVYGGAVFVILLVVLNTNIVGLKPLVEQSTVTKFIVETAEKVLDKNDQGTVRKIQLKVYKGDILSEVSDQLVFSFAYIDEEATQMFINKVYMENIDEESLTKDEAFQLVKESVSNLYNISIVSNEFDDLNVQLTAKFVKLGEEMLKVMNKKVSVHSLGNLGFSIEEQGDIKASCKEAGLNNELLILLEEIFVGK